MQDTKKPIFFVFTCVKNGKDFIEKLFDSLIKQTSKNFIHYIYDDGSDEKVDELVLKYKKQVEELDVGYQVIYESNEQNIGLNLATKHCIEKCTLKYFIWIDCDNWVGDSFFEELEKTALNNPSALIIRSNCCAISENNKMIKKFIRKPLNKRNDVSILMDNYYYSFFAVNYELYFNIDRSNLFIDKRDFFNDVQILFKCALSNKPFVFSKRAYGYMLLRNKSEFNKYKSFNYLEKEQYFLALLNHLGIETTYNIHEVLLARNTLESIKQNNLDEKYWENILLTNEKRKLLKKNRIAYKYGEVYCRDITAYFLYFVRHIFHILRGRKS